MKQPTYVGNAAIYFGTVVLGQLTSLILLPLFTRYLGPEGFGEYSLVLAFTGLLGTFGSTWIRNVGMRLYFDHVADRTTRAFLWTAASLQTIGMLVVLSAGYVFVRATDYGISVPLYAWAGASVLVSDFYTLATNTLRAGNRAVQFGAAELASSLLRLGATWAGLALGFRSPTSVFALVTGSMGVASLVAARGLRHTLSGTAAFDGATGRELVRLGLPSIPMSLGTWAIALSDRLLLAHFADLRTVGMYAAAYGIADRAVSGLTSALFMGAGPAILRAWSEEKERAAGTIADAVAAYSFITVGPAVALVLHARFVVRLLAGAEYEDAAGIVGIVVAGVWVSGASTYFNRPLELTKRYGALSALSIVAAVVNVILNLLLIPSRGVVGAAEATLLAYIGMAILSRIMGERMLRVPVPWSSVMISLGAAGAAALVGRIAQSPWVSIPIFMLAYFSLVGAVWARTRQPVQDASSVGSLGGHP